jgi:hypothetical protein
MLSPLIMYKPRTSCWTPSCKYKNILVRLTHPNMLLDSHAQQKLWRIMGEAHAVCKYMGKIGQPLNV